MPTNNLFMTGLLCVWYAISPTANPRYRNPWGRSVISSAEQDMRPSGGTLLKRLEFRDLPPVPPQHPEPRQGSDRREKEEEAPPRRFHHEPGGGRHEDP